MSSSVESVVIIGSGPAAWTAAIYAARAGLSPLVVEGGISREMIPGGQLMFTTEIENFPGFPEGISGTELMEKMKAQALRFGTRVVSDDVISVDLQNRPFNVETQYSSSISARSLIVATGARANWLGLSSEERLARSGGGVSSCAVCDGALPAFKGKRLVVVGGGDSAMEEAVYLTKFASEVVIVHRRDSFKASRVMAERALGDPLIKVMWNSTVSDVIGDDFISGVEITDTVSGEKSILECGGLFVAIGHTPNTGFLNGQIKLHDNGYIAVAESWKTVTSVEGVFAAGDVMDSYYRQAISAAGSGCMAALEAERWLAMQESSAVHSQESTAS